MCVGRFLTVGHDAESCEQRLKLANDDTLLEQELREAEQQASRFPLRTTEQIGDYEVVREIAVDDEVDEE